MSIFCRKAAGKRVKQAGMRLKWRVDCNLSFYAECMGGHLMNVIGKSLLTAADLLYPPVCPACGALLTGTEKKAGFCRACRKEVIPVTEPSCKKCGKILSDPREEYCEDCAGRGKAHVFAEGRCLFVYSGPMRAVMYRFKYENRRCYAEAFAATAVRNHGRWLSARGIDEIIPVPMYGPKEKKRGYNQAAVFGRALSRATGIPFAGDTLLRVRDTPPMKGLSDAQRARNLKSAFHMKANLVQFKKILLVDDIYTTGTTVDLAAACLLEGGAEAVYCMYICAGDGRRRRKA